VNEAGSRACAGCGKWPSLFDLQEEVDQPAELDDELFETETAFEPDVFEPDVFEPDTFEPEPVEDSGDGTEERGRRVPRWLVSAIWIAGILIWLLANALGDR
jgi:hypothetical protein